MFCAGEHMANSMLRGQIVRQMKQIIAISILLCVTLANTAVLRAIHMHQHGGCRAACDASSDMSRTGERQRPIGHHDPDKCPFCIQSVSAKTLLIGVTELVMFAAGPAEAPAPLRTFLPPVVLPASSSPRAPPFVSL
jgi:hypothetical protein